MNHKKTPIADYIDKHLGTDNEPQFDNDSFSSDELASLINEARLNELLAKSDAFVTELNSEIDAFKDNDDL